MSLIDFISVINADEVVHIIDRDDSVYFGTVRSAYEKIDNETMHNAKVISLFHGFGGMCIEISRP